MGRGRKPEAEPYCAKCHTRRSIYTVWWINKRWNACWNCGALHEHGSSFQSLAAQFATAIPKRE